VRSLEPDEFVFSERWWDVRGRDIDDEARREILVRELRLEVGEGHTLFGAHPTAVASCQHCDDVILELDNGQFAVVHLVWQGPQCAPWPDTDVLEDWDAVVARVLEHEDA